MPSALPWHVVSVVTLPVCLCPTIPASVLRFACHLPRAQRKPAPYEASSKVPGSGSFALLSQGRMRAKAEEGECRGVDFLYRSRGTSSGNLSGTGNPGKVVTSPAMNRLHLCRPEGAAVCCSPSSPPEERPEGQLCSSNGDLRHIHACLSKGFSHKGCQRERA